MKQIEEKAAPSSIRGEMAGTRDLYEFLVEAELPHYYDGFKNDLKVQNVPQLKYVEDQDLSDMGMTKPEMRRLKKFFRKECPQGTFSKLKRMIVTGTVKDSNGVTTPPPVSPATTSPSLPKPSSKYMIQEESITTLKTLGTGEFGTVQQGVWTTEEGERVQVAIKCVTQEKMHLGRSDFIKEATVMHSIDHDHIVRLYGVVLAQDSLMLVTELAPLRSLLECIKDQMMRSSFPVHKLCDFAIQICDGMAYLENKRLIHRDLAARNILVYSKDKVKISDFGLSRALGVGKDYYQTNFNVNLKLPIAWCAPESISYLKFTSASDVWAYGVTLWEMFTYGFQPWAAFTGQQILEAIDEPNCQRLEKPDCCPKEFYSIMNSCWRHEPEDRPKFSELLLHVSTGKPNRVQVIQDSPYMVEDKDYLNYKTQDVITILDDKPEDAPEEGLCKGVLDSGKTGFFRKLDTTPYIEVKTISGPLYRQKQSKLSRKESGRKAQKGSVRRLDASMISGPANDLRHTGHIGYDGAVFGDVSFIGDNYTRLPMKTSTTKSNGSLGGSAVSLPKSESDGDQFISAPIHEPTRMVQSFTAFTSSAPKDTIEEANGRTDQEVPGPAYDEIDDLDSFKMPDMSMSDTFDLGLGGSLMDDIMKALTVSQPTEGSNPDSLTDDKSPLIEREPEFPHGKTSFDNIAMNDRDSVPNGAVTNGSLRQSGSSLDQMGSQASSLENQGSDTLKKKKKPKLKILIPGKSHRSGVRSLSESEEKKMDDAIRLAHEYASKSSSQDHVVPTTPSPKSPESLSDHSHGESDCNNSTSSQKLRAVFRKKKKSPKQEKKTFTEEIASKAEASEEIAPEAQEVYNELIGRGSLKERDSINIRRHSREERINRSMEHQRQTSPAAPDRPPIRFSNTRNLNMNIRAPIIPGRCSSITDTSEVDANPLRQLRAGSAIIPSYRSQSARLSGDSKSKMAPKTAPKPILSANTPFFDKLKEQERLEHDSSLESTEGSEEGSVNNIPVPPRTVRPSSVTTKPRQRKYPLDLSQYNARNNQNTKSFTPRALPPDPGSENEDMNSTRDSEDSVFSESSQNSSSLERSRDPQRSSYWPPPSPTNNSPFSVKSVKLTAKDLGYMNTSDLFWSKDVSLQELGSPEQGIDLGDMSNGHALIPGRYKTSDTVSYEDLLEFALDGVSEREHDLDVCDEVRLMRRVLTTDVTVEDCMYALEDTQWEVNSAIKLIKLKQLLSTNLADMEPCKEVLLLCRWNVAEAADYLLRHPPGQESPELVHV